MIYVTCWPYFAARMQQLVRDRTSAGDLRFRSSISASRLWGLVLRNMLLVIVTLGLYWPFAAVAIARYRVESLSVEGQEAWPLVHALGLLENRMMAPTRIPEERLARLQARVHTMIVA